jgi:hypothetical protein
MSKDAEATILAAGEQVKVEGEPNSLMTKLFRCWVALEGGQSTRTDERWT